MRTPALICLFLAAIACSPAEDAPKSTPSAGAPANAPTDPAAPAAEGLTLTYYTIPG